MVLALRKSHTLPYAGCDAGFRNHFPLWGLASAQRSRSWVEQGSPCEGTRSVPASG